MANTLGNHNTGNTDDLFVDVACTVLILMFMALVAWPFPSWNLDVWNLGAFPLMQAGGPASG